MGWRASVEVNIVNYRNDVLRVNAVALWNVVFVGTGSQGAR
jgi:hypothetical protein